VVHFFFFSAVIPDTALTAFSLHFLSKPSGFYKVAKLNSQRTSFVNNSIGHCEKRQASVLNTCLSGFAYPRDCELMPAYHKQ
jgi:hypothetical protein